MCTAFGANKVILFFFVMLCYGMSCYAVLCRVWLRYVTLGFGTSRVKYQLIAWNGFTEKNSPHIMGVTLIYWVYEPTVRFSQFLQYPTPNISCVSVLTKFVWQIWQIIPKRFLHDRFHASGIKMCRYFQLHSYGTLILAYETILKAAL